MIQTFGSSFTAGIFRIALVPVDTLKTILQVEGKNAMKILSSKYNQGGIRVFFHGALASAGATMVGHYPWFSTYNYLSATLPQYTDKKKKVFFEVSLHGAIELHEHFTELGYTELAPKVEFPTWHPNYKKS